MGFFFLLRRSEYLTDHGTSKSYAIQRRDVTFWTREGGTALSANTAYIVQVKFRGSKTDQRGLGTTRTLEQSTSSWLCPVKAAWALVSHGKSIGLPEDSLLCTISKDRHLSVNAMTAAIKRAAVDIGEQPSEYGTHSLRSGGATALFAEGVDRLAMDAGAQTVTSAMLGWMEQR